MTIIDSIIYGVIQALCEFLPISSSGHLAVLPKFLNIQDPGVTFDLYLHIGTILSLVVYFRTKLFQISQAKIRIIKNPTHFFNHKGFDASVVNMIITTLVTIGFILLFKPITEAYGREGKLIAINLALFGALLYFTDKKKSSKNQKNLEQINLRFCFQMGLAQAFAIFPGVSRSGATITMGRYLEFDRRSIAEFTFLLSIPIITIGALYKGYKIFLGAEEVSFSLQHAGIGVAISFFLGLLVVHYFLKMINKIPFIIFFLYRVSLALILLTF